MKKRIFVVLCIVMIIVIAIIIKKKFISLSNESKGKNEDLEIIQDDNTGEYIVYDKDTGEEITRSTDEASLYIYTLDSEYNPKNLEF